jgi:hypothetical protein
MRMGVSQAPLVETVFTLQWKSFSHLPEHSRQDQGRSFRKRWESCAPHRTGLIAKVNKILLFSNIHGAEDNPERRLI